MGINSSIDNTTKDKKENENWIMTKVGISSVYIPCGSDDLPNYTNIKEYLLTLGSAAQQSFAKIPLNIAGSHPDRLHIARFFRENPSLREHFFIIDTSFINISKINDNKKIYSYNELLKIYEMIAYMKKLGEYYVPDVFGFYRINSNLDLNKGDDCVKIQALIEPVVDFCLESNCGFIISECRADLLKYVTQIVLKRSTGKKLDLYYEGGWNPLCRRMEYNGVLDILKKYNFKIITHISILRGIFKHSDEILEINVQKEPIEIQKDLFYVLNIHNDSIATTIGYYNTNVIKDNVIIIQKFIRIAICLGITPTNLCLQLAIHKGFIPIVGSSWIDRAIKNAFVQITLNPKQLDKILLDCDKLNDHVYFKGSLESHTFSIDDPQLESDIIYPEHNSYIS